MRNHTQVKVTEDGTKIVQFADKFLEEQRAASKDKVSISLEGIEYYRDSLSDLGGAGSRAQYNEVLGPPFGAMGGLSLMDGLCRTYILQRLDSEDANGVSGKLYSGLAARYDEDMSEKDEGELPCRAESLAKAYHFMRKSIVEGYESGTREVWTMEKSNGEDFRGVEFEIDGNPVRYSRLSREEELEKLSKAFERLIEDSAKKNLGAKAPGPDELLKKINHHLKIIEKEEAMNEKGETLNIGTWLTAEKHNRSFQTAAGGSRQAQYDNYRHISRMTEDAQSLLGNIRA